MLLIFFLFLIPMCLPLAGATIEHDIVNLLQLEKQLTKFVKHLVNRDKQLLTAALHKIAQKKSDLNTEGSPTNKFIHGPYFKLSSSLEVAFWILDYEQNKKWYRSIVENRSRYDKEDQNLITQFEAACADLWQAMDKERNRFIKLEQDDRISLESLLKFLKRVDNDLNPYDSSRGLEGIPMSIQRASSQAIWEKNYLERYGITNWDSITQQIGKYQPADRQLVSNIKNLFDRVWLRAKQIEWRQAIKSRNELLGFMEQSFQSQTF